MIYKLIPRKAFQVIGVELNTTTQDETDFNEIPQFWNTVLQEERISCIPNKRYQGTVLGVSMDFDKDGSFTYIIGAEVTHIDIVPQGMVYRTIPSSTYAMFTAKGQIPVSIQQTSRYIYQQWLPNSAYRRTTTAEYELYDERCKRGENAEVDIYIPVVDA